MAMDARKIVLAPEGPPAATADGAAIRATRIGIRALSAIAPGAAAQLAERLWFTPPRARIRDELRAQLTTGARSTLDVDGRSVTVWRWGKGPAVILVHGWGGFGAQMLPFVEPLTRAGFEAIIFDAPAHGESGPSKHGKRKTTLFEFAYVLDALAESSPNLAGVVAHSGGATAAAWALSKTKWRTQTAVFVAPMGSPLTYRAMFQRAIGLGARAIAQFNANTERRFGFRWKDFEVPDMAARFTPPPSLLVHDRDDAETSWKESAAIAEAWPGSALMLTDGLGHRRVLRDPAVVKRIVDFISTRGRSELSK